MRQTIADYQLRGPAPSTASAPRWLARPPARLAQPGDVIVTELPDPGPAAWPAAVQRLRRVAAVRSAQLVRLLEAGRDDTPAAACTWVASTGADLEPLQVGPAAATLRAVAGAARGAHALHQAGLVHGAISADTILVDAHGDAVLLPPIATGPGGEADAVAADRRDLDGVDPAEVWEGPTRTGDIWSLAATVHVLIGGGRLHPGIERDDHLTATQRALYEPVTITSPPGHPVGDFLRACLAPDPADRPPTAAAVADELDRLAAHA